MSAAAITATVTQTVSRTVTATASTSSAASSNRATPQGGVLEGVNPVVYNASNPIILFIIQAGIIIIFCRLLHYPLSKLRQPRVIAEVIGGIILGPSVMMRIPHFQTTIFPTSSMANLNLVANFGLILFLFLVGLEVNMRLFLSNWRVALSVGLAGMALPFGLGCAIAYGLYHQFRNEPGTVAIDFGVYMLFIGTALSITAFPVLCRILTELKLLHTPVGVTVLAAGVGNDVVGWILLALCVALVNNGSGLVALYVLLVVFGWVLFLVYAVRPAFVWALKRSGSIENGPTQGMVCLTLLMALVSAWFTGIIGVHPIFGAFLMGLICPHDGGFAVKLTEKVEDLVAVLFLPLYFALSGLSTNLGLLNNGVTWGYVIGVIAIAFSAKIIGGTMAAKLCGGVWRESFTIGVLMSCKGLVELIVLNIGLQAKILSTRTFTIFVVMALVTTVSTTPLTLSLYPPWYQKKLESWKRGEIDWDGNPLVGESGSETTDLALEKLNNTQIRRILVYLRLDSLPSLFTFISLLGGNASTMPTNVHMSKKHLAPTPETENSAESSNILSKQPIEVHGLRILELTERTSSVMKVSEHDSYAYRDPVVNAFRTFAQLNNVAASGDVSIVPESAYAKTLTTQAAENFSDLVLIPWSEPNLVSELDPHEALASGQQEGFIQKTLDTASCNTAVFYNRGFGRPSVQEGAPLTRKLSGISVRSQRQAAQPIVNRSHHIFFPFFGGADDRLALRFVLQLAQNTNVTLTIAHFAIPEPEAAVVDSGKTPHVESQSTAAQDTTLLHTLRDSLPNTLANRVVFSEVSSMTPISECLNAARQEIGQSPKNAGDLIVVGRGRHNHLTGHEYASGSSNQEVRKTLGVLAESFISAGMRASVLVLHAGGRGLES